MPLGFVIGSYATVIGAGGGFLLAPILLLLYPKENPETITSISLAVVFFNSLSGSLAYARAKRIDYKSGFIFSVATIPGAISGALTTPLIPRGAFDVVFGILMMAASAYLFSCPKRERQPQGNNQSQHYPFPYNPLIGVGLCFSIGYITSLLGIGGGFIEVPAMVYFLNFPVHIATATSQFIVAVMAFSASATHIAAGLFHRGARRTVALAIGVIVGAQLGARLSEQLHGDWIIRCLAIALGFVGVGLIVMAL
jgi:uncharacterized membrane protein YfcA